MDFRLEFSPKTAERKITHEDVIFLVGSCFSENLGEKLSSQKFNILQNPHGILFNPFSITDTIKKSCNNSSIGTGDLFSLNDAWHSWSQHSRFSHPIVDDAVAGINRSTAAAHQFLKKSTVVLITLGSAFAYELTAEAPLFAAGKIAANNHKAPASWFTRKLLPQQEIKSLMKDCIQDLRRLNSSIEIIFTVSPVRHLREGFIENNRSKSLLLSVVHELCETEANIGYFPAYELVIDDLRDYRFYAEDMVHPNYTATNYVWKKFQDVYFSEETKRLIKQIAEINLAVAHRPFNAASEGHKKFRSLTLEKIHNLVAANSGIDFSEELAFFSNI